jgi:betaine-aldehyde dehydrogenase
MPLSPDVVDAAPLLVKNNFINGRLTSIRGERRLLLIDPTTSEPLGEVAVSGTEDVDHAYAAAVDAFQLWRSTTPAERSAALRDIASVFDRHRDELCELESLNTGKSLAQMANDEMPAIIDQIHFFAGAARLLEGRSAGEYTPGLSSMVRREPVGVIGQVAPWNYPLQMAVWKFAPAIAAGNTVVLKPSDTTPLSTVRAAELIGDILPPGVLNIVVGDRHTGRAVVRHPDAAMVSITGSIGAGIDVATAAASGVKRTHLELGGNAPALVFADTDLDATADKLSEAAFYNAGQDCTAPTRMLVQDAVYERFAEKLAERARAVAATADHGRQGPAPAMPALNNPAHFARVTAYLDGLPAHARVLAGGARREHAGLHIAPTVIADVSQADAIVTDEVFGPIITLQRFDLEHDAIALANGLPFGLGASVWTTDVTRAMRIVTALDFGTVWVNAHIPVAAEMPHGGFKQSGYGKDLSSYGLDDYTRLKHVMVSIA